MSENAENEKKEAKGREETRDGNPEEKKERGEPVSYAPYALGTKYRWGSLARGRHSSKSHSHGVGWCLPFST